MGKVIFRRYFYDSSLTGRREFPSIAALAVYVVVASVEDGVVVQLLGAGGAGRALLVVAPAAARQLLGLEHSTATPGGKKDQLFHLITDEYSYHTSGSSTSRPRS